MPVLAPRAEILDRVVLFGGDVLACAAVRQTKRYRQHGQTSCFAHCVAVAYVSVCIARRLGAAVDERALIRGALLHDYFLYDWHKSDGGAHRLHGLFHPARALANALCDFDLSPVEMEIILRHMFPVTPVPPRCLEALIVCLADKFCAVCERLFPAFALATAHIAEERALRRYSSSGQAR